ncbi:hypothetical protein [Lacrimispora sp. 38-1]|uniref:hypothetical protein n=1 Tax=Lacrimispora sp. 38-1 TaxID=3125778 RepID=UPI003CF25D32
MNENKKEGHKFGGYEYKQVVTNSNKVSFLIDGYKNFGWTVDENISSDVSANISNTRANVILRLKRNRKIMNRMELTRLQKNFEFCLKDIDHLERSKTSEATMYALITGIVGSAFMAGSVFAVTAEPPRIALCIIMAIPAAAGWIFPYFIYNYILSKRTEKVNLLIEEKQDEIFEICERGNKLLH